jgi:hypothetical protein
LPTPVFLIQETLIMSIRKFFNDKARNMGKKTRILLASATLAFGAAGGAYIGQDVITDQVLPQVSSFTLQQLPEDITEAQFYRGEMPAGAIADPMQQTTIDAFTTRIDRMAAMTEMQSRHAAAVDFINDLRLSDHLSEKNYNQLLTDYNTRIGMDVSSITGNYNLGSMYWQEAQVVDAFSFFFGDDDDISDAQRSKDIGKMMADAQEMHNDAETAGGLAGGLLGTMLILPFWMRRRKEEEFLKLPLKGAENPPANNNDLDPIAQAAKKATAQNATGKNAPKL